MLIRRFAVGALAAVSLVSLSTAVWSQQAAPGRAGAPAAAAQSQAPARAGRAAQDPAAAAAAAAAETARLAALPKKQVSLPQGRLQGVVENGVARFSGIPYAAAPIGDRRWREPGAAPRWQGVRDAGRPGASCAREEDCLFLNIQTPENWRPSDRLPVMIYIHGGSYTSGQGADYDGTSFVNRGVVLVTINYRLGRAGFFAHPILTAEGQAANFGFQDQIAALKWVQSNIGTFGGDRNNVTIFGESAGAASVMYLTLAPQARGLFHKAISQSAFPRNNPANLQAQEQMAVRAAEAAGVRGTGRDAAAALRRLPLNTFPASTGYFDPVRPMPILDNKIIASSIADGYAAGRQQKTPLMIGGTSNDASLYNLQAEQLAEVPERAAMTRVFNPNGQVNDRQLINDYWTAMRMTEPNRGVARSHSAAGQPTYVFYYSYVRPAQRPTSRGAGHASEIPFVFNDVNNAGPEDLATAQSMNAYWASFAKYGNPGAAGGPVWPRYETASDTQIEFANTGTHIRPRLLQAQLDYMATAPGRRF